MSIIHLLQFLLFSIGVYLFNVFAQIIYYTDFITSNLKDRSYYDFIIVGAGTAGSLIAHRLATETNFTFVVLEAGAFSNPLLEIPVLGPLLHGSVYDWNFETVPQNGSCLARKDHKCRLPQGKIVGGSSKLNNMVHVRGNISHYTAWFHGKYDNNYIEAQFKQIEQYLLKLEKINYVSELADSILNAAKELRNYIPGIYHFSKSILTQKNGKRWTLSDLIDASYIKSNVLVEKIIFSGNTASWLSVLHSTKRKYIRARKGIILSAGTLNTPKILQLSGIGPEEVLKPLNIAIRKNLPVGKNLQDHVATGLDLVLFNNTLSVNAMSLVNPVHILSYFLQGKGALTSPGCEVVGFLSTNGSTESDIQFMVLPVGIASDRGAYLKDGLGIRKDIWDNYFAKNFDKHSATILPIVLHPKSKGQVYINSRDTNIPIIVDPKYLSNSDDVKKLVKGIKLIRKFLNTKSMKSIGAYLNPTVFPCCSDRAFFSEAYWECYIRHMTLTSYHPIGTCSMGLPYSKEAVVDTSFRVIGFEQLYVVDGSVLPTLPSGNIHAAIAVMANIFSDNLLEKTMLKTKKKYKSINRCLKTDVWIEFINNICLVKRGK